MSAGSTHGVKIKTVDHGRARWLTPSAGLTGKRIHAGMSDPATAEGVAKRIAEDNPEIVEWARAERV